MCWCFCYPYFIVLTILKHWRGCNVTLYCCVLFSMFFCGIFFFFFCCCCCFCFLFFCCFFFNNFYSYLWYIDILSITRCRVCVVNEVSHPCQIKHKTLFLKIELNAFSNRGHIYGHFVKKNSHISKINERVRKIFQLIWKPLFKDMSV